MKSNVLIAVFLTSGIAICAAESNQNIGYAGYDSGIIASFSTKAPGPATIFAQPASQLDFTGLAITGTTGFVSAGDGNVYAFSTNAFPGAATPVLFAQGGESLATSIAISGTTVFLGYGSGNIYTFSTTASPGVVPTLFATLSPASSESIGGIAISGTTAFVSISDGTIETFSTTTPGTTTSPFAQAPSTSHVPFGLTILGTTGFVAYDDGNIYAFSTTAPAQATIPGIFADVPLSGSAGANGVAALGTTGFVACQDGNIYAFPTNHPGNVFSLFATQSPGNGAASCIAIPTRFTSTLSAAMVDALDQLFFDVVGRIRVHNSDLRLRSPPKVQQPLSLQEADLQSDRSNEPYGTIKRVIADKPYAIWFDGFADFQYQQNQQGLPAFHAQNYGVLIGFDAFGFPQGLVGLVGGYAHTLLHSSEDDGKGSVNSYMLSVQGEVFAGDFYFELGLLGAYNQNTSRRNALGFNNKASFHSWETDFHFGLGYDCTWDWATVEPYASLDWMQNWVPSFQEKGIPSLKVKFENCAILRSEGGLNGYQIFGRSHEVSWTLRENVGYVNKAFFKWKIKEKLAGVFLSTNVEVESFSKTQSLATFGLQALGHWKKGFFLSALYQGEAGPYFITNNLHFEMGSYF